MRQGERRETALLFTGSAQVSINVRNGRHLIINCDLSGGLPGDEELLPEEQAITAVSEASGGSMLPCRKPVGSSQAHTVSALFSGGERLCSCLLMAERDGIVREYLAEAAGSMGVRCRHVFRIRGELCRERIRERTEAGFRIRDRRELRRRSCEA